MKKRLYFVNQLFFLAMLKERKRVNEYSYKYPLVGMLRRQVSIQTFAKILNTRMIVINYTVLLKISYFNDVG